MHIKRTLADGTEVTFELTPREVCDAWEEQEQRDVEENVDQHLSDLIKHQLKYGSEKNAEVLAGVLRNDDLIFRCARKARAFQDDDDIITDNLWDCIKDAVDCVLKEEGINLDTY